MSGSSEVVGYSVVILGLLFVILTTEYIFSLLIYTIDRQFQIRNGKRHFSVWSRAK